MWCIIGLASFEPPIFEGLHHMKRFSTLLVAAVAATATVLASGVNGAIFATVPDGTKVNGNIYASKSDVYLNGGPQDERGSMLSPDGLYYFQVTDPSGAVLLSTDPIECRMLQVINGRVSGVPAATCVHATGPFNAANGSTPVQLMPYLDTPNHGGEYKAWITPVAAYASDCKSNQGSYGFCDSDSKSDNFKVRESAPNAAQISVCKFNDFNANGLQDGSEPFIAHWPVVATGVDGGSVTAQTDDEGCATFTFSGFTANVASQVVTLAEGGFGPDWTQTAPVTCGNAANCAVDAGVITLTVGPGDIVAAPNFGNTNPFCQDGCDAGDPIATATSFPSLTRTIGWAIAKRADRTVITTAAEQATATYTVSVEHDNGTDSDWSLAGAIRVANPSARALAAVTLTASADAAACTVSDAQGTAVAAGSHRDFSYRCVFPSAPSAGVVTIQGTFDGGSLSATAPFDFTAAAVHVADDQVTINDSMVGDLGQLTAAAPSPTEFSYSRTIAGVAGTCTTVNNTAILVTSTNALTQSASQAVRICVGADLSAAVSAATTFQSSITKAVDRAVVQQQGGSAAFNYKIVVTEAGWIVNGQISVTNPNDWQDVVAQVAATVAGAACGAPAAVTLAASSSIVVPYTCTFASAPAASVEANASVSWDSAIASTPTGANAVSATTAFEALTVVDVFNGGAAQTLGVIATPAASTSYAYAKSVPNAPAGTCQAYTNTASILGRAQSSDAAAYACNTTTGARTIGFWQNKNGQGIITASPTVSGVCAVATWLRRFAPFQDLAANASCKTVASYATTVIKNASAAGAAMNAMLKAQMLATSLDVFFSDAALGGNALGAPVSVGSVRIETGTASAAFGGATALTVSELLLAQNAVSNAGGTVWYGQSKATQELAKNVFDAINNEIAPIAR